MKKFILSMFSIAVTIVPGVASSQGSTGSPPVGRTLVKAPAEPGNPYPAGPPGSGFGDTCALQLRDSTTGERYLLIRSRVATARSGTPSIDSGTVILAVGYYAPMPAQPSSGLPKAEFQVDCLKSRLIATPLAPDTR
jgi:hypothetical protein